jgi:histidine triad (HIT) family protein
MSEEKSIFTRIIEGEIPSFKIFENEYVYSFLDINPASPGHVLVIPKEPAPYLHDLSPESSSELGKVLPRICKSVIEITGATSYNIIQNNGSEAGQTVFHVHFHIIPKYPETTHSFTWKTMKLDNKVALELAQKISDNID